MFPYEYDEEETLEATTEEVEEDEITEYGVDFTTGKLTGGKVTGSKAVAVWAWNALMVPRYIYEAVPWSYGSSLIDLIGRAMRPAELSARAEAMVRDTLSQSAYIEDITDFGCEVSGDKMKITFTLITVYGEENMNVEI